MDSFLIELAIKSTWDRLLPFPDTFRITTTPDIPHTKDEYDSFIRALKNEHKDAIEYVTNINKGIVQHNKKSIHPLVTEFEFQYDVIDNYRKNLKYPQRWYLFHGSPIGNWHSILRNGIKNMSGTRFMSSGQTYGAGVYASDNLQTAYTYGGHGKSHCVAVLELLVDPAIYKKTEGIYVIPNDNLLFPRYLLKMTGLPKSTGTEILAYYKKLREGLITPKTKPIRLENDRKMLDNYFIDKLTDYCWLIVIGDTLLRCYIQNYPFTVPILQLVYKTTNKMFDNFGCYQYPFNDWSPQNGIIDIILHAKNNVNFNILDIKKEEYPKLEDS